MVAQRLAPENWIAAGFRALAQDGPGALRAEALARALQTTKGSFYWHFKDVPQFKAEMLRVWQEKVATEIITRIMAEPDPAARINALIESAAAPAPDEFGGPAIEPAMRAWALSDDDVRETLFRIDQQRMQFLGTLLKDVGVDDPNLIRAIYAAYIGLDDLEAKGHGTVSDGLTPLIERLLP